MAGRRKKENLSLIDALKDLCAEKEISPDVLFDAVESALKFAYKKNFNKDDNVEVEIDRDDGSFHVLALKSVVETVEDSVIEISLEDARKINPDSEIDDVVEIEITPKNFGRIAAQAAKQFVVQKLREAERGVIYDEFSNRDNDLIKGRVLRIEDGNLIVEVGKTEAILVPSEQVAGEDFQPGDMLRAYIAEVKKGGKGPQVYLSRTHPAFLRRLVEMQVPEMQEGIIEIRGLAREAGARSKLSVSSKDPNVDAVGSCVGQRGVRIQPVLDELGEEKLDIVEWSAKPGVYVANALSPAKIISVAVSDDDKSCRVVVPDNQLSLAIGKEGQNARLAAKLTGWKIDIKSFKQSKDDPLPSDMHEVDISDAMAVVKPRQKKSKR